MKTSSTSIAIVSLLLAPATTWAQDLQSDQGNRPIECLTSPAAPKTKKQKKAGATSGAVIPCSEFDLEVPASFGNACVFKNGSWQIGSFQWDAYRKKHTFIASGACDQGVRVQPPQSTLDIASPRLGDFAGGKTDKVDYDSKKKIYVSKMEKAEINETKVPIICYLASVKTVSSAPMPCSSSPNDAGYCEMAQVSPSKKIKFSGKWWVRYSSAQKMGLQVCQGGVKVSDLTAAEAEYGEDQVFVKAETISASDFVSRLSLPNFQNQNEDLGYDIAACLGKFSIKGKPKQIRIPCSPDQGFQDWISDRDKLIAELVEKETKKQQNKIAALNKAISKAKKKSELKKEKLAELAELMEDIQEDAQKEAEETHDKHGVYPVDNTLRQPGTCFIAWDPANKNSKLEARAMFSTDQVIDCHTVEVVSRKDVQ